MFERFTEEARQVVVLAQEEARHLRHNYIGTEHVLLGLLRCDDDVAAPALESFGFTVDVVRAQVVGIVAEGEEPSSAQIPFTPRAKKVLELGLREALSLGHNYIGPGHVLLGLLRERDGVAMRILLEAAIDVDAIRAQTVEMLSQQPPRLLRLASTATLGGGTAAMRVPVDAAWLGGLGLGLESLAADIRRELGREPDGGDLLVALAGAQGTLAARALVELGVDLDELWGRVETARRELRDERAAVEHKLIGVRTDKEAAIEANDYPRAAQLRDRERELVEQLRRLGSASPIAFQEVRRRLGIPDDRPL